MSDVSHLTIFLIVDANKFGQRMLEKMGWQLGKGLGANENGITENIKVSYKNDSQGKKLSTEAVIILFNLIFIKFRHGL